MGIFSDNERKNELVLVFDVGSSSVGGALFYTQESGIPKIIFSMREPIILEENLDVEKFLSLAVKSLEVVASSIYSKKLGAPKSIFCILSSPWYISQTRTISFRKNTSFMFTSKIADNLVQKEVAFFQEEHFKEYIEAKSPIRLIELKNIKTMLNGYETSSPLNQKAKEVEMTIFISMSGEQVLQKMEDTIKSHFHFRPITFSSFVLVSFAVVRDMYINQENFLIIDIGGEVTDISMTKKNVLRESVSFPLGLNFITRGVALGMACSLAEAKSYISLYKDKHGTESVNKKLDSIIVKLKSQWLAKFQESLVNISNDVSIPATIYIFVNKDLANFFIETIKTEQFNQYTLTESKYKITFLDTELLHSLATFENNTTRDPSLIIESIYINRFLSKI